MSRERMLEARELIRLQRYGEAREILETVDHPKAREWLAKLDDMEFQIEKPKREPLQATSSRYVPQQVNVNVQTAAPVVVLRDKDSGPGCIVQFIWFIFIGAWLSQLAILIGYLLVLSIILMPFGFMLLNKVPYLATLRSFKKQLNVTQKDGVISVEHGDMPQRPLLVRALYFILIGFWFGLLVLELAWLFTASLILAPVGLWLFKFSPAAITLRR